MNSQQDKDGGGYDLEKPAAKPASPGPGPASASSASSPASRTSASASQPLIGLPSRRSSDDWNQWKGLRIAGISLVLRGIVALVLWGAMVWLVTLVLVKLGTSSSLLLWMVSIAGGFAVGFILTRGLADRAGFVSPILSIMACVAVFICILGGTAGGTLLNGAAVFGFTSNFIAIGVGCGISVLKTIIEE